MAETYRMLIPVIDTETTGFEEPIEAVEFAIVPVLVHDSSESYVLDEEYNGLCGVSKEIEIGAVATHHITDKKVRGLRTLKQRFGDGSLTRMTENLIWAAHNAAYDGPIIDRVFVVPRSWICTYRCAMAEWPEAPGHSNQVLRYWLGLPGPRSKLPPHRALPDAQVTAQILLKLLEKHTPEELVKITAGPLLLRKLRVGKHRDRLYSEIASEDPGYLRWMLGQDFDEDIKYTINHYLRG
jgi:exodeoxyribonuclease X